MRSLGGQKVEQTDAERIAHLEQLLAEKDERIAGLETALEHEEREKERLIRDEPNKDLWYRANFDSLTGLRRREGFIDESEKLLRRAIRERERLMHNYANQRRKSALETKPQEPDTFSVIFLDLDDFKFVNDTFGHSVGDQVLRMVSQVIRNAVREDEDVIGRLGGEELVISLKNQPGFRGVIAERIRSEIAQLSLTAKDANGKERNVPITASIGHAKWSEGETFQDVLDRADAAMYKAKAAGKNRTWPAEGVEGIDQPLPAPKV